MTSIDTDMIEGMVYRRRDGAFYKGRKRRDGTYRTTPQGCVYYDPDEGGEHNGCIPGPLIRADGWEYDDLDYEDGDVHHFCLAHWALAPKRRT